MLQIVVWFSLLTLHGLAVDVTEVTRPDGPKPDMSTMPTAIISNFTITPSLKVNYTVEMTSSSPAVVDSTITFTAIVTKSSNITNNTDPVIPTLDLPALYWDISEPVNKLEDCSPDEGEKDYLYLWLNSADHSTVQCLGSSEVVLEQTFSGANVTPGQYIMTVIVKPRSRPKEILTFANVLFRLTAHLNGNMKITQDLQYQRSNTTFAIGEDVRFDVNLTDRFHKGRLPSFSFYWYNGSELIQATQTPKFSYKPGHASVLFLQTHAIAEFKNPVPDKDKKFEEKLYFKEKLRGCNSTRVDSHATDESVKLGDAVVLNITCYGSGPSAVCWNLTALNTTLNGTCKPPSKFQNATNHQVSLYIGSTGWTQVHLVIYNDVSLQLVQDEFYVYDAHTVNIPALVLPIVFIMIGITISLVGGVYIMRLRRRLHQVEVADFDFEPSISVRGTSLSSMASTVKLGLRRLSQTVRSYSFSRGGENERDMNRTHSMYESL